MTGVARWEPDAQGRLVVAALELFAERGYDQTTVADVAERAGVTERTFFRYFTDKREVLFAAGHVWEDKIIAGIEDADPSLAPLDVVVAGLVAGASLFDERRAFALRRAAVLAATPSLQERELLKMTKLAEAITLTLGKRGVADFDAQLAAETGVAAFRVAFARWIADTSGDLSLGEHVGEAASALRALAGGATRGETLKRRRL
jgi:AcrR family transcriptional regulator